VTQPAATTGAPVSVAGVDLPVAEEMKVLQQCSASALPVVALLCDTQLSVQQVTTENFDPLHF